MDLLLVILMSLDSLLACVSCGVRRIDIPLRAAAVIAGVGTACLGLSFALSRALSALLPPGLFHFVSCGALLVIALLCLFDEAAKRVSARLAARCPLRLRLGGLCLVLEVYAETEKADQDRSGVLSPAEALVLAVPLSLDSLLTGLSIASAPGKAVLLLGFSFFCGLAAVALGLTLGRRLRHAAGQYANIFGGLALLAIALWKLSL